MALEINIAGENVIGYRRHESRLNHIVPIISYSARSICGVLLLPRCKTSLRAISEMDEILL